MKNLITLTFVLVFAMISFTTTSCSKDDETCYECVGFDDGMGNSLEDGGTICEGDDDDNGGTFTEATLAQSVALYEAFGGTCTKK